MEKLTCNNYVDFGKRRDKFVQFIVFENCSNYMDVNFKVFQKDHNKDFWLVQNLTMG